jgi:trans-aconitate methyltransferase
MESVLDRGSVVGYYDARIDRKVRDFVEGNLRVEAAWRTVAAWAPPAPRTVVELGCGIGAISWRMAQKWPGAHVHGLDLSPVTIEAAAKLFRLPNLTFSTESVDVACSGRPVDLFVLMDVYEHIASADRDALHRTIRRSLAPGGRVILTFPTAAYNSWIARHQPELLQPVDELIDLRTIDSAARACGRRLLMFQEIDVWREGDYGHAVIGERDVARPAAGTRVRTGRLAEFRARRLAGRERKARRQLVEKMLGPTAYRPAGDEL